MIKFGPLVLNKNHQNWKSSGLCHRTSDHITTVPIAPHGYQPKKQGCVLDKFSSHAGLGPRLGFTTTGMNIRDTCIHEFTYRIIASALFLLLVRPSPVWCLQIGMLFRAIAGMLVYFPDESLLVGPLFLAVLSLTALLPTKCIVYRGLVVVILVPEERS